MSDWWSEWSGQWSTWSTYRPADLLMFSPRIYWRLFESLNAAAWPWSLLAGGVVLAGWMQARRGDGAALWRGATAALALAWACVGWLFFVQRYAPINWAASAFAAAFALQAAALAAAAAAPRLQVQAEGARRHAGSALIVWALLVHPWLAWAAGRPWQQAELFALAPDPTAIATLGWLLWLRAPTARSRLLLRASWAVPLAWCAIGAATLWVMDSAQAAVPAGAALLALAAAAWPRVLTPYGRRRRQRLT